MKRTPLTRELVRRLAFVLASTVVASPLCSQEVAPQAAGAPAKEEKAITLPKPAAAVKRRRPPVGRLGAFLPVRHMSFVPADEALTGPERVL